LRSHGLDGQTGPDVLVLEFEAKYVFDQKSPLGQVGKIQSKVIDFPKISSILLFDGIADTRSPTGAFEIILLSDLSTLTQRLFIDGFQSFSSAKATLKGLKIFRTIKRGQFERCETGLFNEIEFVANLPPKVT